MADVKTGCGSVEAGVQRDGRLREALRERRGVRAIGEEAAPLEFFEERHCGTDE